jgi:hypothetical protein
MNNSQMERNFLEFEYNQFDRTEKIKKLLADYYSRPAQQTLPIHFMNKEHELPLISVSIKLPMYRLENGRTLSLQDEYLAKHPDMPEDFFQRDSNSPEAQAVQHELLMQLSSIKDIFKTFKDSNTEQSEPLIVTNEGFIVNGNRRLSCWRTLYFDDPETYKHFEYIKVAVLPEADEEAIEDLEVDLQIIPDIRADYSWHTEARLMKKRIEERGESKEAVAKSYHKKLKEVDERIEMLEYAREYLKRKNLDRQWSEVDKDLYFFEQFVKNRKNLNGPAEKSVFESVSFSILTTSKKSGEVEGRLYAKIPDVRKHLAPIIETIAQELPVVNEAKPSLSDDNALLLNGTDTLSDTQVAVAEALIGISVEKQKVIAEIAETVISDESAKEKERRSANYLVNQVKKANAALENAINSCGEDDVVISDLAEELDLIEAKIDQLRSWLAAYENSN